MPSENSQLNATEKPHHYTYLKEFRTQQCPLFLQHKCTQHRPFTCFHWHFMNQRRRRPVRKKDGTFSYSPDVYCTKYDETTGICPEGDECPFLHRTAGDTERRYHLRYYKTSVCVHETDSKGFCVKNGPHCAFAHGAADLRLPVYDVRELSPPDGRLDIDTPLASNVEKDRLINEDPRWNDTTYVLANYKTEQCKRPPRLCRQGYACPSFHNTRDRRRTPKKFKYRSTPCPNVKHGDDWGDPSQCDSGDNCQYCHTRTEQQFHPEIYKSTKCNDMVQTGYCPRGPFCAFAHVEQEMTTHRDIPTPSENSLAAFLTSALPESGAAKSSNSSSSANGDPSVDQSALPAASAANGETSPGAIKILGSNSQKSGATQVHPSNNTLPSAGSINRSFSLDCSASGGSVPQPIGKGRNAAQAQDSLFFSSSYGRAPGSEREDQMNQQFNLRRILQTIKSNPNMDPVAKDKYKLLLMQEYSTNGPYSAGQLSPSSGPFSMPTHFGQSTLSTMSPNAPSFYPLRDTVESVIGTALDEDLNIGELSLTSFDRDDNDTNSVSSTISAGLSTSLGGGYIGASSVPVTIPSGGGTGGGPSGYRTHFGSLSQGLSPTASPSEQNFQSLLSVIHKPDTPNAFGYDATALAFLSQPNTGKFPGSGFGDATQFGGVSPNHMSQSPSVLGAMGAVAGVPGLGGVAGAASSGSTPISGSAPKTSPAAHMCAENQRLWEELCEARRIQTQWEERMVQARTACEAWKKEADDANRRAKLADEEKAKIQKQRDEAVKESAKLRQDATNAYQSGSQQRPGDLEGMPLPRLQQMRQKLRAELEQLDKAVQARGGSVTPGAPLQCSQCGEKRANPCQHNVLCEPCAAKISECPSCHRKLGNHGQTQQSQSSQDARSSGKHGSTKQGSSQSGKQQGQSNQTQRAM